MFQLVLTRLLFWLEGFILGCASMFIFKSHPWIFLFLALPTLLFYLSRIHFPQDQDYLQIPKVFWRDGLLVGAVVMFLDLHNYSSPVIGVFLVMTSISFYMAHRLAPKTAAHLLVFRYVHLILG